MQLNMMMGSTKFSHEPLDHTKRQIRLLTVDSASNQDFISCRLEIHNFDECPKYFAVSYTWGPPKPTHSIYINDRVLDVRENLKYFLATVPNQKYFDSGKDEQTWGSEYGLKGASIWYWIDQICIDQGNIKERNEQVSLMDQIYSNAQETFIWLGLNPMKGVIYDSYSTEMHDIYQILHAPYFSRLWIVQEVLLSKGATLWYGEKQYNWEEVKYYSSDLEIIFEEYERRNGKYGGDIWESNEPQEHIPKCPLYSGLPNASGWILYESKCQVSGRGYKYEKKLSEVLKAFSSRGCENVLDKVYGLLSLVEPYRRISIDYSLSAEQLLYQVFAHIVKTEGHSSTEMALLDTGIALRRTLRVTESDLNREKIAEMVHGPTIQRFKQLEEPLSRVDEAQSKQSYIAYIKDPKHSKIPSKFTTSDQFENRYIDAILRKSMKR